MLFLLHIVAERYPHNVAALAVFTVFLGLFFGAAEGAFRSKANFQIFANLAALVLVLLPLATASTTIEDVHFGAPEPGPGAAPPEDPAAELQRLMHRKSLGAADSMRVKELLAAQGLCPPLCVAGVCL